jgi:hypothetical protein
MPAMLLVLGYLCRRIYCADRGFEAQYEGNYNVQDAAANLALVRLAS